MGRDTLIEWCDSTVNGSSGCDGCELWNAEKRICYAGNLQTVRLSKSLPKLYSPDFSEVRMIPGRFAQAASWSDLRGVERPTKPWLNGKPRCIFVGDLGDTFSRGVTDEYLTRELLGAITSKNGQRHFWMLLTKRPRRLASLSEMWGGLPDNVMAMTTVTDQNTALQRIGRLLDVRCKWRGISAEPLLGPVSLLSMALDRDDSLFRYWPLTGAHLRDGYNEPRTRPDAQTIHWIVAGYESGTDAQPGHPYWARDLRDQCRDAHVPFFFKQWGSFAPSAAQPIRGVHTGGGLFVKPDGTLGCQGDWWDGKAVAMDRVGKQSASRLLGQYDYSEFPSIERSAA